MKAAIRLVLFPALLAPFVAGGLPAFQGGDLSLPHGTAISLELDNSLSTKLNKEGNPFTATVTVPVYFSGHLAIPKGSLVSGTVSRVVRPGRFRGKAILNLSFQSLRIQGKGELPIVASLSRLSTPDGGAEVLAESGVRREASTGRDVGRVAAPGLTGAGIGAIAGGGKGAAIGAGIGAAVGLGTVFTTRGKDLEVRRGSAIEIRLDRPLQVPLGLPFSEIRQK
jgi:hypothetical protein